MATPSHALAVKSLNNSSGRRRFVYKSSVQRIEEIDIDVYRSLDPLKPAPSAGSSFFLDCLVEYRELNTAEDFISFYEEMLPLVQTLPQIILHKELIITSLLSRLQLRGRLSFEPILRLIAALSRDLLEDFIPFLQRIANSFESLLESGADRDPEIIEQIFRSWSCIMMYLQKYLSDNAGHVLRITAKLRYYPKDYVRELMAESVSFLLRKTPIQKLKTDISEVMADIIEEPSETRKSGVGSLLAHVLRITSSRLHSRAVILLPLLVDYFFIQIGTPKDEGFSIAVEVLCLAFRRLYAELNPHELTIMWEFLVKKITDCATENPPYLSCLLTILISMMQSNNLGKISDYSSVLQLVNLLLHTVVMPYHTTDTIEQQSDVIDQVLNLMFCVLIGLSKSKNMSALFGVASQWEPVFNLRSRSLLNFLNNLLKDPSIFHVFGTNILSSCDNLVEIFEEEVVYLMIVFCEKLGTESSNMLRRNSVGNLSRLHIFFEETLKYWTGNITEVVKGNSISIPVQQSRLAVLWGVIRCYCYFADAQASLSTLIDLIDSLDELLMAEYNFTGIQEATWQTLIGAALRAYHKFACGRNIAHSEASLTRFLDLAKRYKLSPHILAAVADTFDSVLGSENRDDGKSEFYLPECISGSGLDALELFAENLCHANKEIRLSTLGILCHFEPFHDDLSAKEFPVKKRRRDDFVVCHVKDPHIDVLNLLRSIEKTPLSISTSRQVILLLSKIQLSLGAQSVPEQYLPAVLSGIVGIFYNRFSYVWNPTSECLAVLIGQYFQMLWDKYVMLLDNCQSVFLTSRDLCGQGDDYCNKDDGLVGRFKSNISTPFDSTPCATVLSLLIQTLHKVPSAVESGNRLILNLFLKFLGYNIDELTRVELYALDRKGKEWKAVLQEWLSLFRLLRNPKAFYQSTFFKDVLQYRLLEENDAEIQMKVLDCLLAWKDDFLLPYSQNLKNLINAKYLREELTRWSLSRSICGINVQHRTYIVPIIIQILIPKVRSLKMLACQKSGVTHRRAVLGFLAQLDVDELPLFFWLLIKPLLSIRQDGYEMSESFWSLPGCPRNEFYVSNVMKHFTTDSINTLSWKKKIGFLHVVEEILEVFDATHLNPFLDLLAYCVAQILASCTSSLGPTKSSGSVSVHNSSSFEGYTAENNEVEDRIMARTAVKHLKDLRSLCLKIIYRFLSKYEDHDFESAFWDLFLTSVEPLIAKFGQEGASSEKPSSLFYCFLAMSKSNKLVPLLHKNGNLVPDIFSMLTLPSASETILSCVFKFIMNLLELDNELDSEDNNVKRILLPHLDLLIQNLWKFFTSENVPKRKLAQFLGKREFTIFSLISKYVEEPPVAEKFLDILLPLLTKRHQDFDTCIDVLQIVQQVVKVLENGSSKKFLQSITPLLISAGLVVRTAICDVLDAIAVKDSSVLTLARVLRELNASSEMEIGGLDYDKVICAYDKVNVDFFYTIQEEHVLVILAHSIQDMSSEELILRQSAFRLLLNFIEFCGKILNGSLDSNEIWSVVGIHHLANNFILKHMGNAIGKEGTAQKVWIDLLREMVLKLPKVASLDSYRALCSDDAEQDFFNNIVHLQKHRRAKALSRFRNIFVSGNLSEMITKKVSVPLFFSILLNLQDGKDEHIRNACLDALASISRSMKWNQYYALLTRCFRYIKLKPDKQNTLLRLVSSILDNFHFSERPWVHGSKVATCDAPDPYAMNVTSSSLRKCSGSTQLPVIQMFLHKNLLPKIQMILTSNTDKVNVTISVVALKLLKLLPVETMELQLPSIIHRIANFLKNRLESVRDEARSALAACLMELGLEYLQFIIQVLKGILKRGYELHVLGYTLNFMLAKFLMNPICGKLDYCLEDLLSVIENDILGDVSEEKEVEKIASKMKETRKQKSYETLKLIAQSITFQTHASKLLSPFTVHLQMQLTQKVKSKLENILSNIATGIECNPSVDQTEFLVFTYGLIEDCLKDEGDEHGSNKVDKDYEGVQPYHSDRLISIDRRHSHLIAAFSLGLLQNYMKNLNLDKEREKSLSLLDPFVSLLWQCLSFKHENVTTTSVRCLSLLVSLPVPSVQYHANNIKNSLLGMVQGSVNASSPLSESCIKLLTTLLLGNRVTLSDDQSYMLFKFPMFVDLAMNPTFAGLSMLKAVVLRKIVVPEIYDVIQIVAELMVQSQQEQIRKKSGHIFLQFLLGYHISEKRLQQHLDFLLANLSYKHPNGREAVLEMLHAIIKKFPQNIVDEKSQIFFVHLVFSLANDKDSKVRSMAAAAIKCLIGHVSSHSLGSIIEYSQSWYLGGKQNLWGAAAQVLGLLVEVMGEGFKKNIGCLLPVVRNILQSALSALAQGEHNMSDEPVAPFWREAYYSLVLFEKILHQFHDLCFDSDLEDVWEIICQFMLHPHLWLHNISNRILSLYFAVIDARTKNHKVPMETFFLMKPSKLFLVAASFCSQLMAPLADDAVCSIIIQNLVFSICHLHSILGKYACLDASMFWSSLENSAQDQFQKAFTVLNPLKGKRMLFSFISDVRVQHDQNQHPFISFLLQKLGKISFQMEANQMKIVFNCFKSISPELLGSYGGKNSPIACDDSSSYAYQMLLPLYKVCEGYTGKVVSDDLKQLAQDVRESIRVIMGNHFIQVYNLVRKNLKGKRDKRKQDEKVMAVVNPERNAKRKLRIAAKHRNNKRRKIMSMKMGRWMH